MRIAIIGFGLEGKAAYSYYKNKGEITVCDLNPVEVPEGVYLQSGPNYLADLSRFDVIVRSPSVKPSDIIAATGRDILDKLTSNTNEFLRVSPTQNIIGVTGTKGKGTTSSLIAKILESMGKRVLLGGNIGVPALDLLSQDVKPDNWVVLELSSYQLIDAKYSPHIAVCLMVEPEHQDWHSDVDEYYNAKTNLFRHQSATDVAIYYALNESASRIASTSKGFKIPFMDEPGALVTDGQFSIGNQEICSVNELKLLGKHNWQNIAAAITVAWQVEQNREAIKKAVTNFTGLPYRLELRANKNGIRYYNDSFSSAPPASIAAIEAIPGNKIIVIGGYDRNLPLENLAAAIKQKDQEVRRIILIGQSSQRVANALDAVGFDGYTLLGNKNMDEIVKTAKSLAQPGDAIVLSPGFPSFDMFKNFTDRGDQFNQAIEKL